jgi:DNA-binding MarR family transcriptional regulator
MSNARELMRCCLYFTAGALAREMSHRADRAFATTGLTPTQAFALLCIADEPGVNPSEIAGRLHIAPSTVTRAVDTLRDRGLVETTSAGRAVDIAATKAGAAMVETVMNAWHALYEDYCTQLDRDEADDLSHTLARVNDALRGRPPHSTQVTPQLTTTKDPQ